MINIYYKIYCTNYIPYMNYKFITYERKSYRELQECWEWKAFQQSNVYSSYIIEYIQDMKDS